MELLPVMAFDDQDVPPCVEARGLQNYWGYTPHSFYSPHPHYCLTPEQGTHPNEFRALVEALHAAGLGVILDVVFNHTAEGGADGPIINFKGLTNDIFYLVNPADRCRYRDFSGCGNTINCNHPMVTRFIANCLEWWVEQMGVDGFRFDLASVFVRGEDGAPLPNPPLPWNIELSRSLAPLPLIAEAWDATGLYHVGAFPGLSWSEWNGRYRDVIRRFLRGDRGITGEVATCIAGSSDLYADDGRLPANSINFVTCHDGFTRNAFFAGKQLPGRDIPDIAWHGIRLNEPPWHDGVAQFLAFTIAGLNASEEDLHVLLNTADVGIVAPLPPMPHENWYPVVDTSDSVTTGVLTQEHRQLLLTPVWRVPPHTVVIFEGRTGGL